jgi:hypothetical protein
MLLDPRLDCACTCVVGPCLVTLANGVSTAWRYHHRHARWHTVLNLRTQHTPLNCFVTCAQYSCNVSASTRMEVALQRHGPHNAAAYLALQVWVNVTMSTRSPSDARVACQCEQRSKEDACTCIVKQTSCIQAVRACDRCLIKLTFKLLGGGVDSGMWQCEC